MLQKILQVDIKMFIFIILFIVYLVKADETIQQLPKESSYKETLKISAQNYTQGIKVDWGDIEQLKQQNKKLELIIEANVTKLPQNIYQIPFLCVNNGNSTLFKKDKEKQHYFFQAIDCDTYAYLSNQGRYRLVINLSNFYNETLFFYSFLNISNYAHSNVSVNEEWGIVMDTTNEIKEDNYWQIDIEVGVYDEQIEKPLFCSNKGVYNELYKVCLCEKGYLGSFCEFEVKTLNSEYNDKIVIQPFEYAFFKFDYSEFYDLIFQINNTVNFNFYYCNQFDTDENLQHKFIIKYLERKIILTNKEKKQNLHLEFSDNTNSVIYWFKNENATQTLEIDMYFKESTRHFLDDFIQALVHYLFVTFIGGFVLCVCSFLAVYCVQKVHQSWVLQLRKRKMEKQLPKMTYEQYKSDPNLNSLNRNNEQSMCTICLGDYDEQEIVRVTPCRHVFHNKCVENWALEKNQCPVCRETIFTFNYSSIMNPFSRNSNANNSSVEPHNAPQSQSNRYQNLIEMN